MIYNRVRIYEPLRIFENGTVLSIGLQWKIAIPYLLFGVLDTIRGHLHQCLLSMQLLDELAKNADEKQKIIESFNMFAKEKRLASDTFFDEIGQHRKRVISTIKCQFR